MATPPKKSKKELTHKRNLQKEVARLEKEIKEALVEFSKVRSNLKCYPLLIGRVNISAALVDDIFDDLRTNYKDCDGRLDVIVDSGGGDIDAAYNLAMLFRKYGGKQLNFIIPRWAKSAATLLVCAGDVVLMSPIAELGPLDPQITELNPLEKRLEQFSPLHIESTLELIRNEFKSGNDELAKGLMERLQFPLTLGSFKKSLEIARQYVENLLKSRMFKSSESKGLAQEIAKKLTEGYADHGFCINLDEARSLGLECKELDGNELDIAWKIHRLNKKKEKVREQIRQAENIERLKQLPPSLLKDLPEAVRQKIKSDIVERLEGAYE